MNLHINTCRTSISSLTFIKKNKGLVAVGAAIGIGIVTILGINKIKAHKTAKHKRDLKFAKLEKKSELTELKVDHKLKKITRVSLFVFEGSAGPDIFSKIISYFDFKASHVFQLLCKKTNQISKKIFSRSTTDKQLQQLRLCYYPCGI